MQGSAHRDGQSYPGPITRWWHRRKTRRATITELNRCGEDEVALLARDVGVTPSELQTFAVKGPSESDLLTQRITALGLDAEWVKRTEPKVLHDLQRVCAQCASDRRCSHDLSERPGDGAWRGYCPNVTTLDTLKSEEEDMRLLRRRRIWRSF